MGLSHVEGKLWR